MVNKQKHTDEELIKFLHDFTEKYGRVPSSTDIDREEGYPRGSIYNHRFKTYKNALEIAGLERKQIKNNKYSDEFMLNCYKEVFDYYKRQPTLTEYESYSKNKKDFPTRSTLTNRFGTFEDINKLLNLQTTTSKYGGYNEDFLIDELHRFYKENGRPPNSEDLEKGNTGYPTRKTFSKYFGSFGNALVKAGYDYRGIENYQDRKKPLPKGVYTFTKEHIKNCIDEYIKTYGEVPSLKEISSIPEYPDRNDFRRLFCGFNNALIEFGYKPKHVSNYSDEELCNAFLEFVNKHGRIPSYSEFNNTEYPSFWCYQNRFGSWNNAVIHYGFEPNNNGTGFTYTFDDGEIVKSKYEFDVSNYLRLNNIKYKRDVLYKDYINDYNGRKNCDYVIKKDNILIFIEIAGFITEYDSKSKIELDYIKRFEHKLKLINNSNLNFIALYPKDFKSKSLDEIFSFLSKQ